MAFVRSSLVDADVLLLVVDVFQEKFPDEQLLRQLRASPAALLVLLNKVDLLDADATGRDERHAAKAAERSARLGTTEQILQRWRDEFPDATVLPIAARRGGEAVEAVHKHVLALLPEHPPFYPKEQLTDRPERFFAAEMLREAIFEHYSQEVRAKNAALNKRHSPTARSLSLSRLPAMPCPAYNTRRSRTRASAASTPSRRARSSSRCAPTSSSARTARRAS